MAFVPKVHNREAPSANRHLDGRWQRDKHARHLQNIGRVKARDRQQVGADVQRRDGDEARVVPAREGQPEEGAAAGRAVRRDRAGELPAAQEALDDPRALAQPDAQHARVGRRRAAHAEPDAGHRPLHRGEDRHVRRRDRVDLAQPAPPPGGARAHRRREPRARAADPDVAADVRPVQARERLPRARGVDAPPRLRQRAADLRRRRVPRRPRRLAPGERAPSRGASAP